MVSGIENCSIFSQIYNSSILAFDEKDRCNATSDIFHEQIQNDTNYIYYDNDGVANAFFSYKKHSGAVFEITSLYVKKNWQRMGIGQKCFLFLEEMMPKGSVLYVKVLKNAPWSTSFYYKMGFGDINVEDDKMDRL